MEQPNYYAIIPANIRYDKRLTPNAKLLYAEITALTNMNGKCFATNDYFAKLYGVSKVSISKWIKNLVDFGYIESEIIYKDGSKEIDNRYIRIVYDPIKEKLNTPIKEKLMDNNNLTDSNNNLTDSNIYKKDFADFCDIKKESNDILESVNPEMKPIIEKWLQYKKERKESYKHTGLKACIDKLIKISNNDSFIAEQIVDESISNNWSGLFPLKNNNTPKKESVWEHNMKIMQEMEEENRNVEQNLF